MALMELREGLLEGHSHNLSPLSDTKYPEDLLKYRFDRPLRTFQMVCDLLVRPAITHPRQDGFR